MRRNFGVPVFAVEVVFGAIESSHFIIELIVEGYDECEGLSNGEGSTREGDSGHLVSSVDAVRRCGDGRAMTFQFDVREVNDEFHAVEGDGVLRSLGEHDERGGNFSSVFTALHVGREMYFVGRRPHILGKKHTLHDFLSSAHGLNAVDGSERDCSGAALRVLSGVWCLLSAQRPAAGARACRSRFCLSRACRLGGRSLYGL